MATIPDFELQLNIADDTFLEGLLLKIRGETIKFASALKKRLNELEHKVETDTEYLEKTYKKQAKRRENKIRRQNPGYKREDKIQAIKVHLRANWLKDGEKPLKHLTSLENKNYIEKKTIKLLEKLDGQILAEQNSILKEVKKHLFAK